MNMEQTKEKRSNSFVKQGSILAFATIFVRIIGVIYRIPMNNILGKTGNAYYSNAYHIYSLVLILSSFGLPVAVSKLVSFQASRRKFTNVKRIMLSSMVVAFISGGFFSALMYFGADRIADFIKMPLATYAIKVLAPTVFLVSFLGVFRGFFQGFNNMLPTAISQIIEQIANAIFSVVFAYALFNLGFKTDRVTQSAEFAPALGATGGVIGTGIGALVALLFIMIVYSKAKTGLNKMISNERSYQYKSYSSIYRSIFVTILPIIMCTVLYNIISIIDTRAFGSFMISKGMDQQYLDTWGVYSSEFILLTTLPVSIASALAASLMPSLTASYAAKNTGVVYQKMSTAIRFTYIVAIPSTIGLAVISKPIIQVLFPYDTNLEAAKMLLVGSVCVVFFSLSTVTNAILQGINRLMVPVINTIIALVVHVILLYGLLYLTNLKIYAVIISYITFAGIVTALNSLYFVKRTRYKTNIIKNYVLPTICAGVMGLIVYVIEKVVSSMLINIFSERVAVSIAIAMAILMGIISYFIVLMIFNVLDESDLYELPFGRKLVRFCTKMHLL